MTKVSTKLVRHEPLQKYCSRLHTRHLNMTILQLKSHITSMAYVFWQGTGPWGTCPQSWMISWLTISPPASWIIETSRNARIMKKIRLSIYLCLMGRVTNGVSLRIFCGTEWAYTTAWTISPLWCIWSGSIPMSWSSHSLINLQGSTPLSMTPHWMGSHI